MEIPTHRDRQLKPPVTVTSNTATVILNSPLTAPVLTADPNPVAQNHPSTLSSTPVTTGTEPYTYQWFQKPPEAEYTPVGSNSVNYTFPGSAITGEWAFLVQVTDSTGDSVNSTALTLTVYEILTFTITVTQTDYGTIIPGTTIVDLGSDQSFTILPNSGYHITDVFVDGVPVGAVTSYTFTNVMADHSITANFEVDGSETYYFIKVASPHGLPTPSAQVIEGGSYSVSVSSPDGDTTHRWVCTGYTLDGSIQVSGTSYTFSNIQANHTITFHWQEQYYLTVVSPYGSNNGEGWYDAGVQAAVSVNTNTLITGSGVRQVFTGWTEGATGTETTSDPITMNAPKTATAAWTTQYQVTYATSGTILQVPIPPTEWVNSGASPTGQFTATITNPAGNTRTLFVSDNRSSTISAPITIIGVYETQYLVTFNHNGLASEVAGTIATISGNAKTCDMLPEKTWINAGNTVTFNFSATLENTKTGEKYALTRTNCTSPLTIVEPTTISADYQLQTNSILNPYTLAIVGLLASIPPFVAVPIILKRRGEKNTTKTITPIVIGDGTISPNTTQHIPRGSDSTVFIIAANSGYKIEDVIIDQSIHLGAERTYKFIKVEKNHTISAIFSKDGTDAKEQD
jgi:hypothetical protein